jgi:hypothetical protein
MHPVRPRRVVGVKSADPKPDPCNSRRQFPVAGQLVEISLCIVGTSYDTLWLAEDEIIPFVIEM